MLSLKIDGEEATPWPRAASVRIDGLDVRATHTVVVMCDGKPQQAFRFRFSQFKGAELCLFLNDLYGTVQLQERSRSPWCRCER